jgi:uncharacterized repeat protein (TIGR01451 family)
MKAQSLFRLTLALLLAVLFGVLALISTHANLLALPAALCGVASALAQDAADNAPVQSPSISASTLTPLAAESYDLTFSTYLGGSSWEHARDVYVDDRGYIYVTGGTASADFPTTPGAYDTTFNTGGTQIGSAGYCDVFVSKFDVSGDLIWSTFLGGPNYDRAYAIEVDSQGYVYVAGRAGPGFPVKNAFQPTFQGANQGIYGDQNAFVAKLEADGSDVVWASYIGTGYLCRDLAIDVNGNAYVPLEYLGSTNPVLPPSQWFQNAYQSSPMGGSEFGVAKVGGDGSQVLWATWLGGSGDESACASIRVDVDGYVYAAFHTDSTDMPKITGVWDQSHNGGVDYYVARFTPGGSDLVFGTYLGGSGDEWVSTHNLALDADGNVYVSLPTDSAGFPITQGPHGPTGAYDIAVVKFSATGALVESTLIGGNAGENPDGIYVDNQKGVFVTGETGSDDFPVTADTAYQSANGGNQDAVLVRLSADFSRLAYATYMGGSAYDNGRSGFLGGDGSLYVTGSADGPGWPTKNAYQDSFAGGGAGWGAGDCVLAKFILRDGPQKAASSRTPSRGEVVTYTVVIQELAAPLTATVTLTDLVPLGLGYAAGTLTATGGRVNDATSPALAWTGELTPTPIVTVTYAVTVTVNTPQIITNSAVVASPGYEPFTRTAVVRANWVNRYLPLILRGYGS